MKTYEIFNLDLNNMGELRQPIDHCKADYITSFGNSILFFANDRVVAIYPSNLIVKQEYRE